VGDSRVRVLASDAQLRGRVVLTAMWCAPINERVLIQTEAGSAKVRRIERRPIVKVAACTLRGTPINNYIEGMAQIGQLEWRTGRRGSDRAGPRA
jgi:PPOX class probable F420-dependent enzyme